MRFSGQMIAKARPMMEDFATGPNWRLSSDWQRLSPITNTSLPGTFQRLTFVSGFVARTPHFLLTYG